MDEVSVRSRARVGWLAAAVVVLLAAALAARYSRGRRAGRVDRAGHGPGAGDLVGVRRAPVRRQGRPNPVVLEAAKRADSRRTEARHRRIMDAPLQGKNPGPGGAVLMLTAAVGLVAAQLSLYPATREGESSSTSMVAPAVVLALCGMNVVARPRQSHRVAGVLGLLAGVATVALALTGPGDVGRTTIVGTICGVLAILGALPSLRAPRRSLGKPSLRGRVRSRKDLVP